MNKRLYISIGIIIAATTLLIGVNYLLSFHKVTFTLEKEATGITIYRSDKQKIKHFDKSDALLLQAGKYYVIPEGKNISQDKINFTVTKSSIAVTIDPDYTKEYLAKLLVTEKPLAEAAVAAKYPTLIGGYVLEQETLYKKGDWFGALLAPKVDDPRDQKTPYRVVLHKEGDKWEVIRRPEYALTSSKYSDVPIEVLRAINKLVQ